MKLNIKLIGQVAQYKLVKVEGKPPFLDAKVDVVTETASGKEFTHWVTCKVWKEKAVETEPLLSKGCMVEVTGRPELKPFSRRDGTPGAELVVHADTIRVLEDEETSED